MFQWSPSCCMLRWSICMKLEPCLTKQMGIFLFYQMLQWILQSSLLVSSNSGENGSFLLAFPHWNLVLCNFFIWTYHCKNQTDSLRYYLKTTLKFSTNGLSSKSYCLFQLWERNHGLNDYNDPHVSSCITKNEAKLDNWKNCHSSDGCDNGGSPCSCLNAEQSRPWDYEWKNLGMANAAYISSVGVQCLDWFGWHIAANASPGVALLMLTPQAFVM